MPEPCFVCRRLDDCHHREFDLVLDQRARLAGAPRAAGLYVAPSAWLEPEGPKPVDREHSAIVRKIANY